MPSALVLASKVKLLGGCEMISRCHGWGLLAELLGLHQSQAQQVMRAYFGHLEEM
jgi:hypothetical protein